MPALSDLTVSIPTVIRFARWLLARVRRSTPQPETPR